MSGLFQGKSRSNSSHAEWQNCFDQIPPGGAESISISYKFQNIGSRSIPKEERVCNGSRKRWKRPKKFHRIYKTITIQKWRKAIYEYIFIFSNADGARTLPIWYIHTFIICSLINSRWLSNDIKVLKIVSFAHEKIIILGSRKEDMKKKRMHAVEESLIL